VCWIEQTNLMKLGILSDILGYSNLLCLMIKFKL